MPDSVSFLPSVPQDLPAPILDQLKQVLGAGLSGRTGLVILIAHASYFQTAPADLDHRIMTMAHMAEKARNLHVQAESEHRVQVITCCAMSTGASIATSIPSTFRQAAALVLDLSKCRWS